MRIFFLLIALISVKFVYAQSLCVGLRDNSYMQVNYIDRYKWLAGYEQSLLNVKIKEQCGRIFTGYVFEKMKWVVTGIVYWGIEYSGNWQARGVLFQNYYNQGRWGGGVTLNYNHDTYLGEQFNYNLETNFTFWRKVEFPSVQKLDLCVLLGNIPEYRENVKRLQLGVRFTTGNLSVCPTVCIPGIDKGMGDYIRVLCNFKWRLALGKL